MNNTERAAKLKMLAQDGLSSGSDEQYRQILEIAEEMLSAGDENPIPHDSVYLAILHKLSQEYFRVFYVDIRTDTYLEYNPYDPGVTFDTEYEKEDFFLQGSKDVFTTLYHEDIESFYSGFRKDKIIRDINDHGEFSLIYRVKHQGGYFFANMKGTRIEGDHDHILVGVKNIDADVKREKEYLINLARAKDEANRDGLTGIRNRHAYLEYVAELSRQIEHGEVTSYAIVVFDVNGLKAINDTLGHQAGDRYIQEACRIICQVFKRSPVFRIGGDEFVTVAKGDDYVNIEHLVDQIELMNSRNGAHGGIVIAAGMAKATGVADIRTVFEQADARMYEDKKRLKKNR